MTSMSDEAKRLNIRWRRILFGFHLLIWLAARLAVGSINQMPPEAIYHLLEVWALIVAIHAVALVVLDGLDRAEPPLQQINRLIEPRERRWSLLAIDALAWIMLTVAIANRVIPEKVIFQFAAPLSLVWLALTALGMAHVLLVLYAEIRDHAPLRKRKHSIQQGNPALLTSDGDVLETIHEPREAQRV